MCYRGAGVALFRENNGKTEVLLGCRLHNPWKGTWSFPGGKAERHEALLAAAMREFYEEVGTKLDLRYVVMAGTYRIRMPFFMWDTILLDIKQSSCIKILSNKNQRLKIYSEFSMLKWVNLEQIKQLPLHCWVMSVIEEYKRVKSKLSRV